MKYINEWRAHFRRRQVVKGLIKRYRWDLILEEIMEKWITASIIERKQEGRRNELVESQKKQKELKLFIEYLLKQ